MNTLRRLRRSFGFSIVAVVLLAIGLGASTTIFTVANAILWRPLPVRSADNLVQLFERYPNIRLQSHLPYALYENIRDHSSTVSEVMGQVEMSAPLERDVSVEHIDVDLVTDNFLTSLLETAAAGRVFGSADDHVAVLSYAAWVRLFGRDASIAGRSVRLAGHSFQIVGVTPEFFNASNVEISPDIFVSIRDLKDFLSDSTNDRNVQYLEIIGRLHPGRTPEQARQEIEPMWRQARASLAVPDSPAEQQVKLEVQSIEFGTSSIREQYRKALLLVLAGASLVLLMVCANVGGLFIARAAEREKEMAVRLALGAGRVEIAWHWLSESIWLTTAGAVGAGLLTWIATGLFLRWVPLVPGGSEPGELRPLSLHTQPDLAVYGFFLAICAGTAIFASLAPMWRSSQSDLNLMLKAAVEEKRHRRLQSMLCTAQVAFCAVLIISALLINRTLSNLRATNPGFDSDHVVTFSVDPGMRHYDAMGASSLRRRLLAGTRELPEVVAAGIGGIPTMRGIGLVASLRMPGQETSGFNTSLNAVTEGYLDAMGIRLLAGRDIHERDAEALPPQPIVVNEAFAHRFFGNDDVIGRFAGVTNDGAPRFHIVGLVSNSHYRSLREVPPPTYYVPFAPQQAANRFLLQVRTKGNPDSVIEPVRELMRSIDPGMPLYHVSTLKQEIDRSLWQERLTQHLAGIFALIAIVLSIIGLYGILAYFVIQHRREIGIRIAIGAKSSEIISLVSGKILVSLVCGILAGGVVFALAGKSIQVILYGVQLFDTTSILQTLSLLAAIGVVATIIPCVRAVRLDPVSTLRAD